MKTYLALFYLICSFALSAARHRGIYALDENWVCNVKKTCLECLRLPHCSWCETESTCFSKMILTFSDYCEGNITETRQDAGLSFQKNAECACAVGEPVRNCYPPGVTEGPECSGLGTCVCGQCVCNPLPFPDQPTKKVMGEFCDYDNFSCEGPKCNEGPYTNNTVPILTGLL